MVVRDIVVIGASAGGFQTIQELAADLPPDLNAAVFLTLHQHPRSPGTLPQILNRLSRMPARHAEDGMLIELNHIYVAPPDYHLVIQNGFMQLSHGPRENLHRPCINVMFRSAATAYGARVAGVLLTGLLDDGAAGLWEIQQNGGATIVQDPDEATFRSMPESAIRGFPVAHILPLRQIAPLLARLASVEATPNEDLYGRPQSEPAGQVCPECGGVMTAAALDRMVEFRCHTGHRFGIKSLLAEKSGVVERALAEALSQSEELSLALRSAVLQAPDGERAELEQEISRRGAEQESLRNLLESARDASQVL